MDDTLSGSAGFPLREHSPGSQPAYTVRE